MNRNIYEMLNEAEINLADYSEEKLSYLEKRRFMKKFKNSIETRSLSKKIAAITAAALLGVVIWGSGLGGYAYAGINSFFYDMAKVLGIEKSLEEYKTVVNQSITKKGITVQLNEVILDRDELVVSATATAAEKLGERGMMLSHDVYINGKRVSDAAGGSQQQIDDYTVQQIIFNKLKTQFSGDLNVKIVFSDPVINEKTIKGSWVFQFKTNGDELALDTREILLDYSFILENGQKISLVKYTSNNLGQKIYFTSDTEDTEYDIMLQGHDDLGEEVTFFMATKEGLNGVLKLRNMKGNLNEKAKVLYLTPYAVKFPEKGGKLSNDFKPAGEEFTIELE